MNATIHMLLSLHGPAVYTVLTALVFLEAAAFVGLVVPGETALIVGGVLAARGNISLPLMLGLGCFAAVAGDSVGYAVGHRFGPAIMESRLGRLVGSTRWEKANTYVQDQGAWAVVAGRWVGIMRALVPSVAGMIGMPYRKFLLNNALGGVAWVATVLAIGYGVGGSITRAQSILGNLSLVGGGVLLALGIGALILARRRTREVRSGGPSAEGAEASVGSWWHRSWLIPSAVLATATLAVLELADGVRERADLSAYNQQATADAVAVRNPLLTPIAETITTLGGVFGIGALMMALLAWIGIRRHNWRLAGLLAGSMGLSVALTLGLKDLVTGVGPPASATIGPGATGFAFPSGYTLNTTVFFGLLAGVALARTRTVFGRIGIVAGWLVASLLVGLSRLYLGYQWLTDVMAGFGVGVGVLAITVIVGIGFGGREWLGRRVG